VKVNINVAGRKLLLGMCDIHPYWTYLYWGFCNSYQDVSKVTSWRQAQVDKCTCAFSCSTNRQSARPFAGYAIGSLTLVWVRVLVFDTAFSINFV